MPFFTLKKTDAKRNLQVIKPCEVALVAGNYVPSLVNLKHDFIDNACQSIERARVAIAAPVEQSGNAELATGGQSTLQVLEKCGIVLQVMRMRVEVDLHSCDAVSCTAPARQICQNLRVNGRRPLQGLDSNDHPDIRVPDMGEGWTLGNQAYGIPGPDLCIQQIDSAGVIEDWL